MRPNNLNGRIFPKNFFAPLRHCVKKQFPSIVVFSIIISTFIGCSGKGLLLDHITPEEARVQKLVPDETKSENPTFIVIGDTQSGLKVVEKFARRENWRTWKMLIFPFYELYWLGNGIYGGINYLRGVPDEGAHSRKLMREVLYRDSKKLDVDFILDNGDICAYDGRRPDHWKLFLKENKWDHPLLNEIPFLPVVGNHDRVNDTEYGRQNYQAVFDYPQFYSVEFKDAVLITLDSDIIIDQKNDINPAEQEALFSKWFVSDEGSGQTSWLEDQLHKYRDKPFKILAMHHAPITFGWHYKDWYRASNGDKLVEKRKKFLELLRKEKVHVLFSGHEHNYQHNILHFPEKTGDTEWDLHLITSSSGGAPPRSLSTERKIEKIQSLYRREDFDVKNVMFEKEYHYCIVTPGEDRLLIQTMEVEPGGDHEVELMEEIVVYP